MKRAHSVTLHLNVRRNGTIWLDASGETLFKLVALRRWLRDWPEHSLNECDHVPMVCETFNRPGEKPCGACAVRKALNLPPLKEYRARPSPSSEKQGDKK